jgi:hypothetical protein
MITEENMVEPFSGRMADSASDGSKCAMQFSLEAWAKVNHFRHQLEEGYYHEKPEVRTPDRRWYEQIPTYAVALSAFTKKPPRSSFNSTPLGPKALPQSAGTVPGKGVVD